MQLNLNLCPGCMEPKSDSMVCPVCGYTVGTPHDPAYLAPGTTLNGRYLAGRLLHRNGESAVYIGFDSVNGTKVLIKEYMPDTLCKRVKDSSVVAVNQNAVAQYKTFMSEFVELNKTLAKLRNVNHINPAVDMFGDNNTGYVVFNFIEGIPLTDHIRGLGGVMTWEQVKKLFPPLFTTLSQIHNAGLIHRGICPDNIIVTPRDELILTGFCVADERTAETELNSEIYDGYAAPEQYSSGKWQGTWTDVYGISALLYRLLTGSVPESAKAREENDVLPEPMSLNSSIPPKVSDVIMNGLALRSDDRIQTVTELVTGLFEEPEEQKIVQTQSISIPRQYANDETYAEGFGRSGASSAHGTAAKKTRPSRHKVFILVGLATAIVMIALMAVVMIALDDNSSSVANGITTNGEPLADIDDLASSLTYQTTSAAETENTQPTLNEVESGETENTSNSSASGNVYIMNDLLGKNYETIKNSPTYASLVFVPEYEFNEENEKGIIFGQSIEKGESYTEGADVHIKVSLGSRYVKVPEYVGMKAKDYFNLLEGKNIKYEEVSYETSQYADGYVCGVSADEDEILDLESGDTLIVYVAYNPAPVTEATTETESETTTEEITEPAEENTDDIEEYPYDEEEPDSDDTGYEEIIIEDDNYSED
ncbi:MAG: PASTA domain-containing protein [Oscillospiraceae bacterium]